VIGDALVDVLPEDNTEERGVGVGFAGAYCVGGRTRAVHQFHTADAVIPDFHLA